MATVSHQLSREFARQKLRRRALRALIGVAAHRELGEPDRGKEAPFALRLFA